VGEILAASLTKCGVGVAPQYYTQLDLYAPGPDGLLFGRRFDLIEFAMSSEGAEPPCSWFTSAEIPSAANHWVGTNVSGYKNPDFDQACRAASQALPDEAAYADNYALTQSIFSTDLPTIPLYYRIRAAAARKDLCHFDLDPTASPLWNIEAFDAGASCNP
jgi:peptide/nickel transport system substrate-binding protein